MRLLKRQLEKVEVNFVEDDTCCPLCDSYDVEETELRFTCCTCGTMWKTLSPER